MIIKLKSSCAMGDNFSFGMYTKENLQFLQACGDGTVLQNVTDHNMNYYKLHNGFLVHKYNAYELKEQTK